MRKVAISLGFAAIFVFIMAFSIGATRLTGDAFGATGLLLTTGVFTIAIAALVRE
jgi:hypothetical protein